MMTYTDHDIQLCQAARLLLDSGAIAFQFPPRLLSDGRKGNWSEGELRGTEPIAVFSTSGAREMALTWTYIVDGGQWPVQRVAKQVREIRGYFAQIRGAGDTRKLIIRFKLWALGGDSEITCRLLNVDVKHSDTIVGSGTDAFHLRTDITADLRIWTKGGLNEQVQNVNLLMAAEPPGWY